MDRLTSSLCKLCPRCRENKLVANFQRNRATKDGLQIHCRTCFNDMAKRRRKAAVPRVETRVQQCSQCKLLLGGIAFRAFRTECKGCERSARLGRYAMRAGKWTRPDGSKVCASCNVDKVTTEFRRDPLSPDGLSYTCRTCLKEYRSKYHDRNRDAENAANRLRATANINGVLAGRREYYRKNREALLSRASAVHAAHPELSRIRASRRRAVMRGATIGDQNLVSAFYVFVRTADGLKCRWCGEITDKHERHVDHIVPLARGGSHSLENLCCACATCNFSKGSKLQEEFMSIPRNFGSNWKEL